jgi:hypothetical protein
MMPSQNSRFHGGPGRGIVGVITPRTRQEVPLE